MIVKITIYKQQIYKDNYTIYIGFGQTMSSRAIGNRKTAAEKRLSRQKKARIPMSCVVSVVGICSSDDGLKISPSQNAQTPPNDKHLGHWGSLPYPQVSDPF